MPLSLSDLRRTLRHPEQHPRHAVELGSATGLVVTASLLREGLGTDDQLEPFLKDLGDTMGPLDPLLQPHFGLWRQLLVAVIIREGVRRRFGSKGVVGFDSTSAKIEVAEGALVEMGLTESANALAQPITWWYERFDAARAERRKRPRPTVSAELVRMGATPRLIDGVIMVQTFCGVALEDDPASPICGEPTDPRRESFLNQLMAHLGWLAPVADRLGWMMIKDGIRNVMDVDGELRQLGAEIRQMLKEAEEEGEEWKGGSETGEKAG